MGLNVASADQAMYTSMACMGASMGIDMSSAGLDVTSASETPAKASEPKAVEANDEEHSKEAAVVEADCVVEGQPALKYVSETFESPMI